MRRARTPFPLHVGAAARHVGALAAVFLFAGAGLAEANGRFPATVNIEFRPGNDQVVLLPATFGLLLSQDGGESFRWVCEDAIGYGGTYDPDYAIHPNGDIYSTTFAGLRVSRDGGCSWLTIDGPFKDKWVGEVDIATDGRIWATTSTGGAANDVYVSGDGSTFASTGLLDSTTWWLSVRSASSNAQRVYVTGYRPERVNPMGGDPIPSASVLRRTDDGGATWQTLPVDAFTLRSDSQLFIEAVGEQDPDLLFARVFRAQAPVGDAIYRSLDGGQTWTEVLSLSSTIRAFLLRSDGKTAIAGTDSSCADDDPTVLKGCVFVAPDADAPTGPTWRATDEQPRMACLGESGSGDLLSCGANWEPDLFSLARSQDGDAWTKVMRFSDIKGPLECPQETIQQNVCATLQWPSLCDQLGICTPAPEPPKETQPGGGCGSQTVWFPAAFLLGVALVFVRRRA